MFFLQIGRNNNTARKITQIKWRHLRQIDALPFLLPFFAHFASARKLNEIPSTQFLWKQNMIFRPELQNRRIILCTSEFDWSEHRITSWVAVLLWKSDPHLCAIRFDAVLGTKKCVRFQVTSKITH